MKKIAVQFDTNMRNDDGSFYINPLFVRGKRMKNGDEIVVYHNNEEWDALLVMKDNTWGIEIISEERIVNNERYEGRIEGFWEGYYCEWMNILRILDELEVSEEKKEFIINKYLR